jgi:DNA polymerase III delta prime subunit
VAAIELGYVERPDAVMTPMRQRKASEPAKKFPKGTNLLTIFESDNVERRLLLLGQPGAGKTTQLLHLAEALLERRKEASTGPVPIYLSLSESEWKELSISRNGKLAPALEWFMEQVSSKYQVPRRRVLLWLTTDPCPIVFLLDGLDEIRNIEHRRRCVRALSQARRITHAGMIVSCRTNDYTDIGAMLNFGSAVDILPLTVSDIDAYLKAANADLESLRQAASRDNMLATLLDTPLMLCVAALSYKNRQVEDFLLRGSLAQRRDHLWHAYVSEMTKRRRNPQEENTGNRRFPPHSTVAYLKFLAQAMDKRELLEFNPGYFNSTWLPSPWNDVLLVLSGLRTLFILGLFAFSTWLICIPHGFSTALLAVIFGSVSTMIGLMVLANCGLSSAADWKWNWRNAGQIVLTSECSGLVFAAVFGVVGGREAVAFGCILGSAAGLSLASVAGWSPLEDREKVRRRLSVLTVFIARILSVGLLIAVVTSLLLAAHIHHIEQLSPPVAICLSACAGFALAAICFSLELLLDHYTSRILTDRMGLFPYRLTEFMAHAYERILLRRVGFNYRFLHLGLRDHFLEMIRRESEDSSNATVFRPVLSPDSWAPATAYSYVVATTCGRRK